MIEYVMLSEAQLVSLLRKGDRCALLEIFDRYHGVLFSLANEWLNDDELAKDLVCDVFGEIWEKRKTVTIQSTVNGFLLTLIEAEEAYELLCNKLY